LHDALVQLGIAQPTYMDGRAALQLLPLCDWQLPVCMHQHGHGICSHTPITVLEFKESWNLKNLESSTSLMAFAAPVTGCTRLSQTGANAKKAVLALLAQMQQRRSDPLHPRRKLSTLPAAAIEANALDESSKQK